MTALFMFQLTKDEYKKMRCQIGTSSSKIDMWDGRRYLLYVFTEQGIYMLMTILIGALGNKKNYVTKKEFSKIIFETFRSTGSFC